MRKLAAKDLISKIKEMCILANTVLPKSVKKQILSGRQAETWSIAKDVLDDIIINYEIAEKDQVPICQDTGLACVFLDIGAEVFIEGDLEAAVNEGVRQGYTAGFLRKSVVADPLQRKNTGDNTPAMIYLNRVPGDRVTITVAPKGFGSENMSAIKMLKPADGREGVKNFILETVKAAGPNPCPPITVGVGLGGTFDKAAYLAKKALLRDPLSKHQDPYYQDLEAEILNEINALGIGPQGFGGMTTALAVLIEAKATHIAGLPCAVNINCHVARHVTEVI